MRVFVSADPATAAAELIDRRLREALRRRDVATLAVSGGSTAPPMLAALAGLLRTGSEYRGALTVWQVDERIVPDGDAERNANQLADLPCAVRLMPVTGNDLRAGALRYAGSLPARFDVVHLGMGDDGHTASWPPDQPDVAASARAVELTEPFHGVRRMTLTARVVNGAACRVVLARGASKRPMLERWLGNDRDIAIAQLHRTGTVAFVDEAAAPAPASLP